MAAPLTPKRVSVPGILSDEGLAQGVSSLKGQLQQNVSNGTATQGVDIGQQILDLDVQMPSPRAPSLPAATPSAIKLSGSQAPQQPAAPGFGMLTPEQGAAEQARRVEEANQNIAALKSEHELSDQLRNMTDEQAETLGIPRDPFATPEEVAATRARLEQQDADYMKQEEERAEYVRTAPDPTMTWWLNSMQVGAKAAATTGTSALKYPFSAFEALTHTATGINIGKTAPRQWLDAVDKHIETILPGDRARAKDFITELSAGAGSFIPFLIAGYVGGVVGLPTAVTAGGLGAAATGNQLYEEAEQFNASMVQKTLALVMGTGLGATEAIPVDRMFMRADVATGGLVRRMLANTTASTLEEFAQEFSQAVGEDMVAKYGAGYDPNRELDASSWLRQGVIGGIVGGGAGALTTLAPAPGPNAAQQVAVVDEVLANEQKRFDALVNEGEPAAPAAGVEINTNRYTLNDPAVGDIEAGPGNGETVVKMDDQSGAPAGMVLVEMEDGTQRLVGEQLLTPPQPLNIVQPVEGAMLPAREEPEAPVVPENEPVAVPPLDGVQRIIEAQASAREASVAPTEVVLDPARPDVKVATTPDVTTPEFSSWFKESAVRDESGAPLKVYHGTTGRGFRSFDPAATGTNTVLFSEQETHRQGFFFAEKKGFAEGFANQGGRRGGTVMELYLSVQNPLDVTGTDNASVQRLDDVIARAQELDPEITNPDFLRRSGYDNFWELLDTAEGGDILVRAARDLGYDGIKMIEPDLETSDPDYETDDEGAVTWVAFEPTQIKSATRNTGDFDPANPDIEAQRASLGLPTRSTIDAVQLSDVDTAPLPNIEKGLTGPIPMVVKAARAYASAVGLPHRRQRDYVRVDTARAARIAQAYADMKHEPSDPAVLASYRAMANETIAQYQFVKATGLKIETILPGQPDPYPNGPRDVLKDIASGHIWYFPTDQGFGSSDFDATGNPLLDDTGEVSDNGQPMVVNDLFRVVHDFFGHGLEGSGFGARGEENAWQGHMRLFSQSAIPAMTSETRGQNSWVNYGPYGEQNRADPRNTVYADQKTGIMPSWTWSEGVADSAANSWAAPVEINDPTAFRAALVAAKENSRFGGAVNVYDSYAGMRTFLSDDGLSGFALNGADIVSVFSRGGGRLRSIIDAAVASGGRTLDAFDTGTAERPGLVQMYASLGFVETNRVPFDASQAPAEWPAELGKPDVVFMALATDEQIESMVADQLGSSEFKAWFGGSKVVDENGNPLVVYHGSDQVFSAFDAVSEGIEGVFFSSNPDVASGYANPFWRNSAETQSVYPVFLALKNPLVVNWPARVAAAGGEGADFDAEILNDLVSRAAVSRYDGVVVRGIRDGAGGTASNAVADTYIAFKPEQIKSAIGNNGNFDPNDPNIDRMATGTSSTRMPYSLEPTRPARGVPEQPNNPPQEGDDVKLTQIGANLRKLLNLTVRHGRLVGGKGVMGEYNRKTGNIRMRTWTDLSTLVHEAGHAINDSMSTALDAFVQRNAAEVMRLGVQLYAGDLSNAPAKTRQREGFAEFFRVYTMTPEYARNKWPALTSDFETTLRNADPAVLNGLNSIAEQFKAWLQLPSSKLIRNMLVDGRREMGINAAIKELKDLGFKTWFNEYTRRAVEHSVNRFAPLNSLVNEMLNVAELSMGAPLDLKRAEDPRTLVRLARNSGSRAMVEVTDGVYAYRGTQPMSRSLRDAIMLSQGVDPDTTPGSLDENRLTDFSAYLVALRARDEYRRMDEGKIDRPPLAASVGDVNRAIRDYEAQYGQSFTDAAAIAHEYGMALWQKQYDAGLMSKETYEDGLERQFYVPLQRDMSDRKENFGPSALTAGQRSLVRQFKGSDRDIVDPIAILMQKTFALEQLINENEVIRSLALLADRAGRTGALVERIPASQAVGMTMSVEDAARQLSRDDSLSAADAQDLMTILGASIQNGATIQLFRRDQVATKGENILFFWENGKPAAIQLKDGDLGADVVNVLQGVGRENMPLFTELVAATSTAFRTAITSWPDFLIVNYIRDQMSAWILSDVGFKPFVSGIRGMADEIRQKQWAKSYNAAQGIMGGMNVAAMHEARVEQDIRALRSKGYLAQAFSDKTPFTGAIRGMARVTALSETGTRLGLYRGAYERAKAEGLNDYEASVEAAYLATDYIDFGLNGTRMTLARRTIPFLNAQLQGLYKMMRTLGADELSQRKGLKFALGAYFKSTKNMPMSRVELQALNTGRKAWVKMASLGLLSAALHFIFRDDPDYEEAGEYLRTTGWVIPMGDGRVFYIPKPFELALIANAVERGIEAASGDAQAPGRFLRGVAQSLTPPTAPTSIQLAVELTANKDFFSGRDIVPSYMQALEPQLQYDNRTSSIAKWMGRTFNWSPLVVDHVLSGLGASAYRDIAAVTNAADPTRPSLDETDAPLLRRFVRDVRRGSVSAQDFWEQASQTTGRLERTYQTYKRFVEYGNETGANGYLATLTADEKAYALLNTHFEADQKRLNPIYRARQLTTLVSGMRREIASELSLSDTSIKDVEEYFPMTARQKQEVDEVLSEIARREVRNTLIGTGQRGWADKEMLPIEPTLDLLAETSPEIYEEYMRRYKKAKIYNADAVLEYWPEVRDRLVGDGEFAVLGDVQAIASVVF